MPTLFISRSLSAQSPLRLWARDKEVTIIDKSLLFFTAVDFDWPLKPFDWVFFYSPRAVDFFFKAVSSLPTTTRLAAVGGGTAAAIRAAGYQPDFTGQGQPIDVAAAFLPVARGSTVLFPAARRSGRSIEKLLGDAVQAQYLVVYDNQIQLENHLVYTDWVILTSPLNVQAYFSCLPLCSTTTYLAIGSVTAQAMQQWGVKAAFPESPSEEGLVALLAQLSGAC